MSILQQKQEPESLLGMGDRAIDKPGPQGATETEAMRQELIQLVVEFGQANQLEEQQIGQMVQEIETMNDKQLGKFYREFMAQFQETTEQQQMQQQATAAASGFGMF